MKMALRILSFIASVFILFFMGVFAPFIYSGGHIGGLFVPGEVLTFIFLPFGAMVFSYGIRNALWAFEGVLTIFFKREPLAPLQELMLKSSIRWIYAAGIISFISGLVITSSAIGGPWDEIAHHVACAFIAIFYAVVLAELVIRPALTRSELLRQEKATSTTHPSFAQLWLPAGVYVGIIAALIILVYYLSR